MSFVNFVAWLLPRSLELKTAPRLSETLHLSSIWINPVTEAEHLMAPGSLWARGQGAHSIQKMPLDLNPGSLSDFWITLTASATLTFSWVEWTVQTLVLAPGPLHWVFLLPGPLLAPVIPTGPSSTSCQTFLPGAFPDYCLKLKYTSRSMLPVSPTLF